MPLIHSWTHPEEEQEIIMVPGCSEDERLDCAGMFGRPPDELQMTEREMSEEALAKLPEYDG